MRKFLWLLLALCQAPGAVEVENLYEAEVLAESRRTDDRHQAIRQALQQVLDRIVISQDKNRPSIRTALAAAPHYVREFQFSLAANSNGRHNQQQSRLLRVRFDEKLLQAFFKADGIGLWNEIRPETLLWLVVEKHGQRQFFNSESMPGVEFALSKASRLKGLPIIFPLLDMEEQRFITPNDVLSADPKLLLDVSSRYDVVSVLAGRLAQPETKNCWTAEWALYFNQKVHQWNVDRCVSLNQAALSGMWETYDILSDYYGAKPLSNRQQIRDDRSSASHRKSLPQLTDNHRRDAVSGSISAEKIEK